MKSFAHRPVTFTHPKTMVNSKNWKRYSKGMTGAEVVRDGEYVKCPMVLMDAGLIDAYEKKGIRELSVGYTCDLKWERGTTPRGEMYDAVQTGIRGNHLAVVPTARGGDQLRIGDDGTFRAMVDRLKLDAGDPDENDDEPYDEDDDEDDDEDKSYMGDYSDARPCVYDTDFSEKQRARLAKSGAAMPGGGFPIRNAEDLHHAMEAIGRAKDPDAARAHIRERAKALGLESELSASFKDAWSDEARAAALEARQAASHHKDMANKHFVRHTDLSQKSDRVQNDKAVNYHLQALHHFGRANEEYKKGQMKNGDKFATMGRTMGARADKLSNRLLPKVRDSSSDDTDYVDCPQCGADINPEADKCPDCGAYVSPTKDHGEVIMKQVIIDGVPVDVATEQGAAIVDRHVSKLERKLKDAKTERETALADAAKASQLIADAKNVVETKDGEIAALKQKLKDAEITPEKLDVMVKDRMAVVDRAVPLLGKTYSFDGKKVEDIRRDAVIAKLGDAGKNMTDAEVGGAFAALSVAGTATNGTRQFADALRGQSREVVSDAVNIRDKAHAEAEQRLRDAWKTPVRSVA